MPESVDRDGAVSGPAPRENSSVSPLYQVSDAVRRENPVVGAELNARNTSPQVNGLSDTTVVELAGNEVVNVKVQLAQANQHLSDARASHSECERRLERITGNLLIRGERFPAHDQPRISMMQEAFLNASTAAIIAVENILILQEQIARLEAELLPAESIQLQWMSKAA